MKILIIRFGSIGDIVLTSPVVRIIKEAYGEKCQIYYLTKNKYSYLISSNENIDQIISFSGSVKKTRQVLRHQNFDYIIDLHNNLRSKLVSLFFGKKLLRINKNNVAKWLMVHIKSRKNIPHFSNRCINLLSSINLFDDKKGLDFFIPKNTVLPDNLDLSYPYIVWAIGGQHSTKKMPLEKLKLIGSQLKKNCYIIGGNEDAEIGIELAKSNKFTHNLCGQINVMQSALLIKSSASLITHDTGMMHIGAAFDKKIISIWGNTVPEFGMYPLNQNTKSRIHQVKNLNCRPCSKIGYNKCPKKHFNCMNFQNIESILDSISNNN